VWVVLPPCRPCAFVAWSTTFVHKPVEWSQLQQHKRPTGSHACLQKPTREFQHSCTWRPCYRPRVRPLVSCLMSLSGWYDWLQQSRERTPVPSVQETGWASEPVWTQRLEEKSFAHSEDRTSVIQSVVKTLHRLRYPRSFLSEINSGKPRNSKGIFPLFQRIFPMVQVPRPGSIPGHFDWVSLWTKQVLLRVLHLSPAVIT
jgi:hypothetical protein